MKTQNKTYLIAAFFLLTSLLLIIFLIYPTIDGIKSGSDQILKNKGRAVVIDAENKDFYDFQKKYKSYQPAFEKIDQLFVDPQNPIDFIRFLEKISSESGITFDINLAPLASNETVNDLPVAIFQVSAKGSFPNMLQFIKKLESSPYFIRIDNLTIKSDQENSASVSSNFSIETVVENKP